jgi:hypothetical protein
LLFVVAIPLITIIPSIGLVVDVPLEVTPVKLTEATVLLLMFETVPPVIPLKTIPWNFPVEPVNVYVPVCVFEAKPTIFPVIVKPWAPLVAVVLLISIALCVAPVVQVRVAV